LTDHDSKTQLALFDGKFGIREGVITYNDIKANENNETANKELTQTELHTMFGF